MSSVYLAKLCEQAERYDEMVENMKIVASADVELSTGMFPFISLLRTFANSI